MTLSIEYWLNYTDGNVKMRRKSENAVQAGRVLSVAFDAELLVINANVQTSMKDKSYKVLVSGYLAGLF